MNITGCRLRLIMAAHDSIRSDIAAIAGEVDREELLTAADDVYRGLVNGRAPTSAMLDKLSAAIRHARGEE